MSILKFVFFKFFNSFTIKKCNLVLKNETIRNPIFQQYLPSSVVSFPI